MVSILDILSGAVPLMVDVRQTGGSPKISCMRLGIAHHFGWAVAVTASADHKVAASTVAELS
jgi:hypothetical protein